MAHFQIEFGGLAQLARALDLHSRGQGFDSLILHFFETKRLRDGENKKRERGSDGLGSATEKRLKEF